jgi:hypothetical protein
MSRQVVAEFGNELIWRTSWPRAFGAGYSSKGGELGPIWLSGYTFKRIGSAYENSVQSVHVVIVRGDDSVRGRVTPDAGTEHLGSASDLLL